MEQELLDKKIAELPDSFKVKLENYVDTLLVEAKQNTEILPAEPEKGFRELKGFVTYMADDFDAPLKEFHDYMYTISIEFIEKIESLPINMQNEIEASVNVMLDTIKNKPF